MPSPDLYLLTCGERLHEEELIRPLFYHTEVLGHVDVRHTVIGSQHVVYGALVTVYLIEQ